jgi:hypothetical protein
VELSLSKESTLIPPEEADGSKGIFGSIVRGGYKLVRSGVSLTLVLLDRNSGNLLSAVTRVIEREVFPGMTEADIVPPDADDAGALAAMVRNVLGELSSGFDLRVSTDKGGFGAYKVGDDLSIFLESEKDCHVRVYHFSWDDRQLTLIFPNRVEQDGSLKAGEVRRIPGESEEYALEVTEPYGVDVIVAVASLEPFEDEETLLSRWLGGSKSAGRGPGQEEQVGGDYFVESGVDAERFGEVMAKGLIVREGAGSQQGDTSGFVQLGGSAGSESDSLRPSRLQSFMSSLELSGRARATCYFVTIRKLF